MYSKYIKLAIQIKLIIAICLISVNVHGQTLIYDAFIHGHNVGQMKVTREVNDESIKISVDTHIEAHMLVTITVNFTSESTYMNNKLIIGEARSSTNGHLKSSVHTVFKNGYYEVNLDGDISRLEKDDIVGADYYYFEVPENGQELYALATGTMLNVDKDHEGVYYFEHDGKKELHTFSSGSLEELKISHRLYTVTFKRRD